MRNFAVIGSAFVVPVAVAASIVVTHVATSATLAAAQPLTQNRATHNPAALDDGASRHAASADEGCALRKGVRRSVTAIIDAETVKLDDGSVVRLIGALAPSAIDGGQAIGHWPLEIEARAFLQTLVLGKTVQLAHADLTSSSSNEGSNSKGDGNNGNSSRKSKRREASSSRDRNGRVLAHLFLGDDADTSVWVQAALLRAGLARAYMLPGHEACLREMALHEATARRSRLGLWANRLYRIKRAEPGPGLMRFRNRYELVRGAVANVTVTRSATYLNFGTNWRRDFTIRIDKALRAKHPEWSRMLPALKGKTVIVRGWIERRNGPEIKLWSPDQIEIDNDVDDSSTSSRSQGVPDFRVDVETTRPGADNDAHSETHSETRAGGAAGNLATSPTPDAEHGSGGSKMKPARPNIDSNTPAEFDL